MGHSVGHRGTSNQRARNHMGTMQPKSPTAATNCSLLFFGPGDGSINIANLIDHPTQNKLPNSTRYFFTDFALSPKIVTKYRFENRLPIFAMAEQQAQPLLKFSAHHYRAEGVDEQAFAKWYTEEQIPRMIKIIQKHGILHYRLVSLKPVYLILVVRY